MKFKALLSALMEIQKHHLTSTYTLPAKRRIAASCRSSVDNRGEEMIELGMNLDVA